MVYSRLYGRRVLLSEWECPGTRTRTMQTGTVLLAIGHVTVTRIVLKAKTSKVAGSTMYSDLVQRLFVPSQLQVKLHVSKFF